MDYKDFEILQAVYKEGNLTKAADKLFMSQPTVTNRIKQLEKNLGIIILKRGRKGVEFTAKGLHLVKHSKKILTNLQTLQEELWNLEDDLRGTLRIDASKAVALHMLPELLSGYAEEYPLVSYDILDGFNKNIIDPVRREEIHVGIVRGNHYWSDKIYILKEEEIYIISKKPIELELLPQQKRIIYNTDPALSAMIEGWWRSNYRVSPKVGIKASSMEIAKRFSSQGLGYVIVPGMILKENEQWYQIPITDKDGNKILWKTWMLYKTETVNLNLVKRFVKHVLG